MYRGQSVIGMIEDAKRKADVPAATKKLSEQQQEMLEKEARSANDEMEDNYNRNLRNKQQGVEVERMKK